MMIYAIPCDQNSPFNHFAKAPQLMIVDDTAATSQRIDVTKTEGSCGHKKQLLALLRENRVDAVIVRNIGQNMLAAILEKKIEVYYAPRGSQLTSLHPNHLLPVTDVSFGKPSANKSKKRCASQCGSKKVGKHNKLAPRMLSPTTIEALKKVLKVKAIVEGK
ncbi:MULTISPECIES: NifB/NifX family molybdenum-iron cluster-binding protein [Vibrio]|uniref:NifB/NifX family molybdenum-iron cluster-binding protein n=1 Tax=Vibrio TaxID=662 RepID=UPI00201E4C49|nr:MULTISPECIES: NifB/NifX family molybdenum-iron cluster-binding protein [Vibrio]MCS0350074.1 hypothetical protein [Vibrio ordalii]